MKQIKILQIQFTLPLYHRQISQWRGAIIEWAGREHHLFHNHKKGKDRYFRYPLIQYGVHQGKAAILAINEGADQLEALLSQKEWQINWQGIPRPLEVDKATLDWPMVQLTSEPHRYRLQHWLPLSQANYQWWQTEAANLKERVAKLERILLSHVLTFATGIQWQIPGTIDLSIQNIRRTKQLRFHGTPMLAIDLTFDTNLVLPPNIRLGRVVSHGFGELQPIKKFIENNKNNHFKTTKKQYLEKSQKC